jgi:hypothetical protein
MNVKYFIVAILPFLFSCNQSVDNVPAYEPEQSQYKNSSMIPVERDRDAKVEEKTTNGITYRFHAISALDYLDRKGVNPEKEDLAHLREESVILLEMSEEVHDIFESKKLQLSQDDLVMYLCDGIKEDFTIVQEGEVIKPNAVQYEGKIGSGDRIRATFFIKGINESLPIQIQYYDKIFGNGFVKIKLDNNRAIV